jgi:hypothetical protein
MADLVNRHSVTWSSGTYSQFSQGGISGTEIGIGTGFAASTSVLPVIVIPPVIHIRSFIPDHNS